MIEEVTAELAEVGAELSEPQVERLVQLLTDCHNNMRLWCLSRWTPSELMKQYDTTKPRSISFGPNMRKMFESGEMDKDEIIRELKKMGVDVID